MNLPRQFARRSFFFALAMVVIGGCGSDQHELMMRAAQRARPPEEMEAKSQPTAHIASQTTMNSEVASPQQPSVVAAPRGSESPAAAPPSLAAAGASVGNDQSVAAGSEPALPANCPPIGQRRPETQLGDFERRKRSAENLECIGSALIAYVAQHGRLPLPAMKTANGVATLSWRVELLPYLGYEELYRQFDPNQPWDSPQNLRLLDSIPDCYVSPERFDSSTNYLGIAGSAYLFNGNPMRVLRVEDGLENTIAIVEVDDDHAVPWTRPADYAPERGDLLGGLGSLRPDGVYALWANGRTTLLPTTVGEQQLHRAFTCESGDSLVANDIHNALIVEEETNEAVSVATPKSLGKLDDANTAPVEPTSTIRPNDASAEIAGTGSRADATKQARHDVPKRSGLAAAAEQVRDIYAARLKAAIDLAQKRSLAQEMLVAAAEMHADPAGAYTLQSTAVRIAVAIGDLQIACQAIDSQVSMFKVDWVERNGAMLTLMGHSHSGSRAVAIDARAYLRRALPVLHGAIKNDDYDLAESICQFAIQFEKKSSDRSFLSDLNRLRLQVTTARNRYRRAEPAIAQLRKDPSNPSANTAAGCYLAFTKRDWRGGFALLAKGDDQPLALIAAMDIATDATGSAMMSTADAWWDLSDSTSMKASRGACRGRAAYWYARAMETMPESLPRMHAEARLREAETTGPSSALAAVELLADHLGIDLHETLAELSAPVL